MLASQPAASAAYTGYACASLSRVDQDATNRHKPKERTKDKKRDKKEKRLDKDEEQEETSERKYQGP